MNNAQVPTPLQLLLVLCLPVTVGVLLLYQYILLFDTTRAKDMVTIWIPSISVLVNGAYSRAVYKRL
jgi:hypothetical protein